MAACRSLARRPHGGGRAHVHTPTLTPTHFVTHAHVYGGSIQKPWEEMTLTLPNDTVMCILQTDHHCAHRPLLGRGWLCIAVTVTGTKSGGNGLGNWGLQHGGAKGILESHFTPFCFRLSVGHGPLRGRVPGFAPETYGRAVMPFPKACVASGPFILGRNRCKRPYLFPRTFKI